MVDLNAKLKINTPIDIGFVDIINEKAIVIIIAINVDKIIYKCELLNSLFKYQKLMCTKHSFIIYLNSSSVNTKI